MPATAQKKTKPAPAGSATAALAGLAATIPAAVAKWRAWTFEMAGGAPCPVEARELLDVAQTLGIREPGPALDHDAQVVADVKIREARAKAIREQCDAEIQKHGGVEGIRDKLVLLQRQIEELKAVASCGAAWNAVELDRGTRSLRKQNARIYSDTYSGEAVR